MNSRIICAFPGSGKSYYFKNIAAQESIIDLDSNEYTSGHTSDGKVHNDRFPANYIEDIKKHVGSKRIVLVSCHIPVIKALVAEGFEPILIYPEQKLLPEYRTRYKARRDSQPFIDLLSRNWDMFLQELQKQRGCEHIVLKEGQYISDIL